MNRPHLSALPDLSTVKRSVRFIILEKCAHVVHDHRLYTERVFSAVLVTNRVPFMTVENVRIEIRVFRGECDSIMVKSV